MVCSGIPASASFLVPASVFCWGTASGLFLTPTSCLVLARSLFFSWWMENGKEQRDLINLLVEGNEADSEVDLKPKKYLRW